MKKTFFSIPVSLSVDISLSSMCRPPFPDRFPYSVHVVRPVCPAPLTQVRVQGSGSLFLQELPKQLQAIHARVAAAKEARIHNDA
jgi:hypothetical protein